MTNASSESAEANISDSDNRETGWHRVKALFELRYGTEASEEIQHIPTVVGLGSLVGFIFGGRIGARIASDYHVKHNKLTIYKSQMQAQRELHSAVTLGFIRYGCKWGWRLGLFAGLYSCLIAVYSAYRNKNDAFNYVAAGASTGAVFKMFSGWRGVVVGIVMGGGLSLPVGIAAQVGNTFLLPDEYRKEIKQKQEHVKETCWIFSSLPVNKQVIALSATYPEHLAQHLRCYMREPTFVRLNADNPTLKGLKQFYCVVPFHPLPHKTFHEKVDQLLKLLSSLNFHQCLIFSNYQIRAQSLCETLCSRGWPADYIAGSQTQSRRLKAMDKLKNFKCRILISTDLTARGIDAERVNLVVNMDLPRDSETYLHRIGRAGRFGTRGVAVTYVAQGKEEREFSEMKNEIGATISPLPEQIPESFYENKILESSDGSCVQKQDSVVKMSILRNDKFNCDKEDDVSASLTNCSKTESQSSLDSEEKIQDGENFDYCENKQSQNVNYLVHLKDVELNRDKTVEDVVKLHEKGKKSSDNLWLQGNSNNKAEHLGSEVSCNINGFDSLSQRKDVNKTDVGCDGECNILKTKSREQDHQALTTSIVSKTDTVDSHNNLMKREIITSVEVSNAIEKQKHNGLHHFSSSASEDSGSNGYLNISNCKHEDVIFDNEVEEYQQEGKPSKNSLDNSVNKQERDVVLTGKCDNSQKIPENSSNDSLNECNYPSQKPSLSSSYEDLLPLPDEFDKTFEEYLQISSSKKDDPSVYTSPFSRAFDKDEGYSKATSDTSRTTAKSSPSLATFCETEAESNFDSGSSFDQLMRVSFNKHRLNLKLPNFSNKIENPVAHVEEQKRSQERRLLTSDEPKLSGESCRSDTVSIERSTNHCMQSHASKKPFSVYQPKYRKQDGKNKEIGNYSCTQTQYAELSCTCSASPGLGDCCSLESNFWQTDLHSTNQECCSFWQQYPTHNALHNIPTEQHRWSHAWKNAYQRQTDLITRFVHSCRNYNFM